MTEDQREAIQQSNRVRHRKCGKCGALYMETVDGMRIGGLPGIEYLYCQGCGWSTIAHRPSRNRKEVQQ